MATTEDHHLEGSASVVTRAQNLRQIAHLVQCATPTQLALTVPAQYVQMELNRTMIEPHASAALLGSLARVGSALGATLALSPMWTARRVKHAQQGMLALAVFVMCVHQVRSPMLAKQCV